MTLTATWARRWADDPGRLVLVDAVDGARWTAANVEAATRENAGELAALGIRPGDRVLLSCEPSVDTVLAYVALLRLGAAVVPANTAYTASELAHVVADCAPVAAVVDDVERVEGLAVPLGGHRPLCDDLPSAVDVELDRARDDDLAMVAYTSGTTGRPKGACLTHGNLLAGARSVVEAWEWTPDDRLVHALPMFHMHGLGVGLDGALTAGASVVVLPRFDPAAVVEAAATYRATMFFGVPTMYALLAAADRLAGLEPLRLLVSGSAPLDPTLSDAVEAATGQRPLERYGMTETVMLTSNPLHGERRPGSVGPPLPGVEVRLGADDVVEVRGPNVFGGYWRAPEASADAFTPDGWFRTGDVGRFDADGYLRLVGRVSELVITGGYNVYPREVEDVLRSHPAVADAAVAGRPDPTWGEVVVAYVVPRGELDLEALARHAAERLAPYKCPRVWQVVAEVPRNAMGKVQRDRLAGSD